MRLSSPTRFMKHPKLYRVVLTLLCFFPLDFAKAQVETVTVTAESMSGIWKIGLPVWGPYRQGTSVSWGPIHDFYCRFEGPAEHLRAYCPRLTGLGAGDVTLNGNKIHIAWGTMMVRFAIDATEDTPGVFSGSYVAKIAGFVLHAPGQLNARKVLPEEYLPDAAGKAELLADILNHLSAGERAQALQKIVPLPKDAKLDGEDGLRELGAVSRVGFLGRTPTSAEASQGHPGIKSGQQLPNDDAADVYDVEFAKGDRVCTIRQRSDGLVDELDCI
jgi:hypothetical protein